MRGDNNEQQPSYLYSEKTLKWKAWNKYKGLSKQQAMIEWFKIYNKIYKIYPKIFKKYEPNCNLNIYDPFKFVNKHKNKSQTQQRIKTAMEKIQKVVCTRLKLSTMDFANITSIGGAFDTSLKVINSLVVQLQQKDKISVKMHSEMDTLKQNVEQKLIKKTKKIQELEKENKIYKSLKDENEKLKAELDKTKNAFSKTQQNMKHIENDRNNIKKKLSSYYDQIKVLKNENESISLKSEKMRQNMKTMEKKLNDANKEKLELFKKQEHGECEAIQEELNNDLKRSNDTIQKWREKYFESNKNKNKLKSEYFDEKQKLNDMIQRLKENKQNDEQKMWPINDEIESENDDDKYDYDEKKNQNKEIYKLSMNELCITLQ
eukprot:179912_1